MQLTHEWNVNVKMEFSLKKNKTQEKNRTNLDQIKNFVKFIISAQHKKRPNFIFIIVKTSLPQH